MEKWEYKELFFSSLNYKRDSDIKNIKKLGLEGWEMVGFNIIYVKGGLLTEDCAGILYWFKRKLSE